jgi:glutathione S-transferase
MLTSVCQTGLSRATSVLIMLDFGMLRNGPEEMGAAAKHWDGREMRNVLTHVERELKESPEGGYFAGKQPGRADIMFEFPLSSIKQRKAVDLKAEFPLLDEWLERVYSRPAWKRGIEKGNGYDLTIFPQRPHL